MKKLLVLCIAIITVTISGCGKDGEEAVILFSEDPTTTESPIATPTNTPKPKPTPEPLPTEDLTGKAVNLLTGYYIDEEAAKRRPVAVVINNLKKALPQSGISQADIIYEVLAEGDITRLIAIFQDFNSSKIGPVRSARDYFLHFARDNNAFFVHHGGSPKAYSEIKRLNVNNLDGMKSSAFWRDQARMSQSGMYEHSSYTNAEKILGSIQTAGYNLLNETENNNITQTDKNGIVIEKENVFTGMFNFYNDFTQFKSGTDATKIIVPFSGSQNATFTYDIENRNYKRFQFGAPHIDEETGEQLAVDNVIIQFTNIYVISGDEAGRREVDTIGKGRGYLISGGKYVPITWNKSSYAASTQWFDATGNKLTLNKGKTWICVFENNKDIIFE